MPSRIVIPYVQARSNAYRKIKRPMLTISIYSRKNRCWIEIPNMLADTGADISILPRTLGQLLVGDFKKTATLNVSGLSLKSVNKMHLQKLTVRLGGKRFRADFAISGSDDIPPTLGRMGALDKFDISYHKGRNLIIRW